MSADVDQAAATAADPKAHRFEPEAGKSNADADAACKHCQQGRGAHYGAKCGSVVCDGDAAIRVFWPGKTTDMCIDCAARAIDVSHAMGFRLAVAPVGVLV
jgi:hypothetical protein